MLTKEDLTKRAEEQAEKFFVKKKKRNGEVIYTRDGHPKWDENKSLSSSQLRKFFGEFKRIKIKLDNLLKNNKNEDQKEIFKKVIPQIMLQAAQVNYAAGRQKVPEAFRKFIEDELNKIDENSPDSFYDFMVYFEAVVGYYYYLAKKGGIKRQ